MAVRLKVAVVLGAVALAMALPAPARACSPGESSSLAEAVGLDAVDWRDDVGTPARTVVERAPMVRIPHMILFSGKGIMAITRYWGEEPGGLANRRHEGGEFILSWGGCSVFVGPYAEYEAIYELEDGSHIYRWLELRDLADKGRLLASDEAILEAQYGPPVVVEFSTGERIRGYVSLLFWRVVVAAFVVYVIVKLGKWGDRQAERKLREKARQSGDATR